MTHKQTHDIDLSKIALLPYALGDLKRFRNGVKLRFAQVVSHSGQGNVGRVSKASWANQTVLGEVVCRPDHAVKQGHSKFG